MEHDSFEARQTDRSSRRGAAIIGTILYTVIALSIALLGGIQLYDWARTRILDASALAVTDFSANVPSAPASNITLGDAAPVAGNETAAEAVVPAAPTVPPINVLLLGTDARADDNSPPRTDTIILLTLDPNTLTVGMLSLPRDLWVPIPTIGNNKINTAYQWGEETGYAGGGVQLIKDTVSQFIGQSVPYHIRVNFSGFVELVDMIEGVDVVVPQTIHDETYPTADYGVETFHLEAGSQHLDGETALKYARTRHVDSDYGRARRQQTLIRAVMDKVLRADMIPTLLPKALPLLSTMRNSIETDIPLATQIELANYMRQANPRELQIRQLVIDGQFGDEGEIGPEGAWILKPDRAKVRVALAEFFNPAPQDVTDGLAMANPDWVRIEVLNGTNQPGVAARTRDLLVAQGWHVVSIGDADRDDYGRTIIINYGVPEPLLEKVSADLDLQPNLSSLNGLNSTLPVDVRIVVGEDILPKVK